MRDAKSSVHHVICGKETRRESSGVRNTPSHGRNVGCSLGNALKVMVVHEFVMCRGMMLGIVVCTIQFARRPVKVKLTLRNTVLEPVVAHVKSF